MSIPAIGAIPSIPAFPAVGAATGSSAAPARGAGSFASVLGGALDALQGTQSAANTLAQQAATGHGSLSNLMVASTQAQLAISLTTAVRNQAVSSFTQIMSMPL